MHSCLRVVPGFLLLLTLGAVAAPSQEFWEYMADFSDENGEVLDPLELDEIATAREPDEFEPEKRMVPKVKSTGANPEPNTLKKTELKMNTSSAPAVSHKGATL